MPGASNGHVVSLEAKPTKPILPMLVVVPPKDQKISRNLPMKPYNASLSQWTLKQKFELYSPAKYVIPKSLNFSHWPSKMLYREPPIQAKRPIAQTSTAGFGTVTGFSCSGAWENHKIPRVSW